MRKALIRFGIAAILLACLIGLTACSAFDPSLPSYNMKIYDLGNRPSGAAQEQYDYMFENVELARPSEIVDVFGDSSLYLGHPDSVLLDNGEIITAYPEGHGKGKTILKRSKDDGKTWDLITTPTPESFVDTQETPTIYKLNFRSGDQKLIMISGRPGWGKKGEGFDVTLSTSKTDGKCNGEVWESHKNYFGPNAEEGYVEKAGIFEPIVAMASLTQIKKDGEFIDKWMGIFHDYDFNVYKTFLTFDTNGEMYWTRPARVLDKKYRSTEKNLRLCEPEVVRSPDGKELAMLFRVNSKKDFSQVSFSSDEGNTWSKPQGMSRELTGERHKAEYTPDGRLVITFRAVNWKPKQETKSSCWYSRGWVTWVGKYEDLKKGLDGKGDYVIKMAHTYLDGQTAVAEEANSDTGYAGLVITNDGTIVASSYGKFSATSEETYIITKRFKLADIEKAYGFVR